MGSLELTIPFQFYRDFSSLLFQLFSRHLALWLSAHETLFPVNITMRSYRPGTTRNALGNYYPVVLLLVCLNSIYIVSSLSNLSCHTSFACRTHSCCERAGVFRRSLDWVLAVHGPTTWLATTSRQCDYSSRTLSHLNEQF